MNLTYRLTHLRSTFAVLVAVATAGCSATTSSGSSRAIANGGGSAIDRERALCAEIPVEERDHGPFANKARIVRVEAVHEAASPKAQAPLAGAAVYVLAAPGETEQWLGRIIECHAAHRAVASSLALTDEAGPLAVDNTRIAVSPTTTGFRIAITSDNRKAASEILSRGLALLN